MPSVALVFLAGLAVGLVVAVSFLLLRSPPPPPGLDAASLGSVSAPSVSAPGVPPAKAPSAAEGGPPTAERPRAPEVPADGATTYDFFTLLPDMEVKVPDWQERDEAPPPDVARAGGRYVFQVGSFQREADADRAKARLALEGVAATIQPVLINGRDRWYRVLVGPFADRARFEATRTRLRDAGIEFITVRDRSDDG